MKFTSYELPMEIQKMSFTSDVHTIYTISIICTYEKILLVIFISAYD